MSLQIACQRFFQFCWVFYQIFQVLVVARRFFLVLAWLLRFLDRLVFEPAPEQGVLEVACRAQVGHIPFPVCFLFFAFPLEMSQAETAVALPAHPVVENPDFFAVHRQPLWDMFDQGSLQLVFRGVEAPVVFD